MAVQNSGIQLYLQDSNIIRHVCVSNGYFWRFIRQSKEAVILKETNHDICNDRFIICCFFVANGSEPRILLKVEDVNNNPFSILI